ncbi:MAG: DUF177 domain-containing protein [Firmicutes bacterium]|nr:DUF177 domain-containing protein [Bacillota bacterium]
MKINISDILKNESGCLEIEYNDKVEGLESPINGYTLPGNVSFKGTLTRLKGLLNFVGIIKFEYDINCYRCLNNIHGNMSIGVNENILNAARVTPQDDVFTYEGDYLDIDIILKNYIILNLPMKQICSDECKGLCPICGSNLNEGKCSCSEERYVNPQMEVLKFFFE